MSSKVWINARFITQPLTGVQRYALEVAGRLGDRCAGLVAPPGRRSEYEDFARRVSIQPVGPAIPRIPGSGHLWEQAILPFKIPAGDLLWSPGNCGPLRRKHQVLTCHDIAFLEHPEWYRRSFSGFYGLLLPRLLRRVQHIMTSSQFSRQRMVDLLNIDPSRITVIYPGVDDQFSVVPPDVITSVRERYGLRRPYLLAVGAATFRKNLHGLYAAWERLGKHRDEVMLVIAGAERLVFSSGSEPPPLKDTRCLGAVDDADLPALYAGALAFVYPSLYEGFGMPPLEAMACGTPVIASNATAVPEAVGDAALCVEPNNPDAIAEAIGEMIGNQDLRDRLRERGLKRVREFTWEQTAEQVWQVLEEACRD